MKSFNKYEFLENLSRILDVSSLLLLIMMIVILSCVWFVSNVNIFTFFNWDNFVKLISNFF